MKILLASKSPRRFEILKRYFASVEIVNVSVDENLSLYKSPSEIERLKRDAPFGIPMFLGALKGQTAAKSLTLKEDETLISADTIVFLDGEILGKPKDEKANIAMLKKLSGRTHFVFTGYGIFDQKGVTTGYDTTKITFRNLSDDEIENYVKVKTPMDKAGGYGVQDSDFVLKMDGNFENAMGLPLKIIDEIKNRG